MAGKKKADVEVVEKPTSDLATVSMSRRQDAVAAVTSLAELQRTFGQTAVEWQEIEPSFEVMPKDAFEDVPFVIAGFRLNESTKYAEKDSENSNVLNPARFVSMLVANYDPDTGDFTSPWVIVNDGSTGIRDQLLRYARTVDADADITRENFNSVAAGIPPIVCSKGLRKSEYDKDLGDQVIHATTWYIA